MKHFIRKFKLVMAAMLIVLAFSCSAEDGAIGPAGPAGTNGVDGADGENNGTNGTDGTNGEDGENGTNGTDGTNGTNGENGTDGTNGEDGNANVISSEWFRPIGQTFVTNGYTSYAEFNVDISGVDPNLLNNGTILVFAQFYSFVEQVYPPGHISALPLTISGGTTDHIFTYYFNVDNLKIRYRQVGPAPTWSFNTLSQFRYVVIPSSSMTGKSAQLNFEKMSYNEVMNHFNIK